jgi:Glycosyl hydrolase family 20, catalytic domain
MSVLTSKSNFAKNWLCLLVGTLNLAAAENPTHLPLPVRGFCIAAPSSDRLDEFIKFISEDLAPRSVNVLILRVDYGFQFLSQPEMADSRGLSKEQAQQIAAVCKQHHIRIVPLVNLLGHQSWQSNCGKLLKVYPEFDETPAVRFPEKYAWPNADRLYCKSYCPRHPKVHEVVFALVDEVCDAFGADAFHAGMDEVFYIGEEQCPRCKGRNKAELLSDEVRAIRDHLQPAKRQLWLWGDRLLDGKVTGLGEWEASRNDTHAAVDLIPKDVVICDWHYARADQTAVYFAMKGLDVVSCSWKSPDAAAAQVRDMRRFRESSTPQMKQHFQGVVQTIWSGAGSFLDQYYGRRPANDQRNPGHTEANCFKKMFEEIATPK